MLWALSLVSNYEASYWAGVNGARWNACELEDAHSGVAAVSAFQPQPRKVLKDYVIILLLAVLISVEKSKFIVLGTKSLVAYKTSTWIRK